jgi:hypothetical protein
VPLLVFDLPVHVLLAHAVVVLVPLAVLGSVTIAVRPAARRQYGLSAVAVTAAATVSVPLATEAGEALERTLPPVHAHLGHEMLPLGITLLLLTAALLILDRARHDLPTRRREVPPRRLTTRDRAGSGALPLRRTV